MVHIWARPARVGRRRRPNALPPPRPAGARVLGTQCAGWLRSLRPGLASLPCPAVSFLRTLLRQFSHHETHARRCLPLLSRLPCTQARTHKRYTLTGRHTRDEETPRRNMPRSGWIHARFGTHRSSRMRWDEGAEPCFALGRAADRFSHWDGFPLLFRSNPQSPGRDARTPTPLTILLFAHAAPCW